MVSPEFPSPERIPYSSISELLRAVDAKLAELDAAADDKLFVEGDLRFKVSGIF